jgi:undecaprenyl diphosphate synthase
MSSFLDTIDRARVPRHVAVIMDGNGRWAMQQGMARAFGHQSAIGAVRDVTAAASELGVEYLTLYTFSTENWNRPEDEITALMELFAVTIEKETPDLNKNNVRLVSIGDHDRLPKDAQRRLKNSIEITAKNTGLTLVLALSYSARWEIINAVKLICQDVQSGKAKPEDLDDKMFDSYLTTKGIPDPDLLIRTSGEMRISNFLLWQLAYSELYFTNTLWPDFDKEQFYEAICDYQSRERRFGKTGLQLKTD